LAALSSLCTLKKIGKKIEGKEEEAKSDPN
jgi:hypothetical protein